MSKADRKHRPRTPSRHSIADAQRDVIDWLNARRPSMRIGVHAPPERTCWGCGYAAEDDDETPPERAHIVPLSEGGSPTPSNYVLLCWRCHKEQPDEVSLATLRLWMLSRESHQTKQIREAKELTRAIERAVAEAGLELEAILEEWFRYESESQFLAACGTPEFWRYPLRFGINKRAASANFRWRIVDLFLEWLNAHPQQSRPPNEHV